MYSKNAMPHEIRMMAKSPNDSNHLNSRILRWPYQARVIKEFESNSKPIV
jgi:hypothetical protein